ncbi:DUF2142 domain-containing protein [Nocardioides szechwanensis]|nr:DUF2142 domain-containing protein [Nocardioides szechwanensis]
MGRRGVALVISGFLLLQVAWMITIPPFRGIDEIDHAYRAAAVAHGDWVAGEWAPDGRGWLVEVPASLVAAAEPQCRELKYYGPDNCEAVATSADGDVLIASSAAGYHPAFYWVIGTAARPFDGTAALYAMRIAAALMCLLFLGLAVWATGRLSTRWPTAALLLAASPVLVYSTTVAAPNGLEMSAGLSLWCSLLAFAQAPDRADRVAEDQAAERRLLGVAIASAVVLGTLRLLGPLFIVLIVASVAALQWRPFWAAIRQTLGLFCVGAALVGASVAAFAWWTFGPYVLDTSEAGREGPDTFDLGNLALWPLQSIAAFPYRDQMGSLIVYPVVGALVIALVIVALRAGTRHEGLVLLASLLTALAVPVVLSLLTLKSTGVIWQGRYGLPYAVGFVLLGGVIMGRRPSRATLPWSLTVPALLAYAVAIVACLLKVLDAEMRDNAASAADPVWQEPGAVLLSALVALAVACFAAALSGQARDRADGPAETATHPHLRNV